ncbi:DUF4124 domain-containing protein [Cupriavidus basilensis]|uniref:DUF4124 domain-containing protein n=1 Tax=Cupriavidus basilensis TaxID=68895 RepID=UPI00283B8C64|nr:DUF4124 domain-containing protein [Cupriavidus basilensis]MDR3379666.1 DUF4124 domain-containing protein [Cupriavidus basilensis]
MKRSTAHIKLATLAALACLCQAATAQGDSPWQWRDASGRMVYSDVPPPPSVPAASVIKAPGRFAGSLRPVEPPAAAASPAGVAAATQSAPAPGAKGNGNVKKEPVASAEEAFEKRRAAQAKAEADQAAKDLAAQERQVRCAQSRNYAASLQQNRRIAVSAPDGSLQQLNDDERQAELMRVTATLEQNCT